MRQGDWFTSLDLKDADFQVPILKAQGHFFAICLYGCGLRIPVPAIQLLSGLVHLLKVGRGSDILTRRGSSTLQPSTEHRSSSGCGLIRNMLSLKAMHIAGVQNPHNGGSRRDEWCFHPDIFRRIWQRFRMVPVELFASS